MQNQDYSIEGQPLHPQWDVNQHTLSSGEQQATEKAPLQQGDPFGQHQGHPGGYGQAAFKQGPFATAAAPEHNWEPQPAGVLDGLALPAEVSAVPYSPLYLLPAFTCSIPDASHASAHPNAQLACIQMFVVCRLPDKHLGRTPMRAEGRTITELAGRPGLQLAFLRRATLPARAALAGGSWASGEVANLQSSQPSLHRTRGSCTMELRRYAACAGPGLDLLASSMKGYRLCCSASPSLLRCNLCRHMPLLHLWHLGTRPSSLLKTCTAASSPHPPRPLLSLSNQQCPSVPLQSRQAPGHPMPCPSLGLGCSHPHQHMLGLCPLMFMLCSPCTCCLSLHSILAAAALRW